jgi:hypothetical protein
MMPTRDELAAKRLRRASILIILSLAVQGFSLVWRHPLAFVAFLLVGGLLLLTGLGIYVWVLLNPQPSSAPSGKETG